MGIIILIITAIAVLFSIGAYNKNKAPIASAQTLSINEDSIDNKITLKATDKNNDKLTYKIVQKPQHGILKTDNTNKVTYTPTKDYFGKDSFSFKANDGKADSNIAKVTLNIKDIPEVINHKPIAFEQNLSVLKNKPQNIALKATDEDNDTLTYTLTSTPQHGSLSGTAPNIIYTPNTDYEGNDTISFKAYDGKVYSNESKVNLKVTTSAFSNVWAKFIPNASIKEMVIDKNSNNLYLIGDDIFAKYNTNGEQIWTKPINLSAITTDMQGNIYGFMGSKFFKYNPNGDEIFAQDINRSIKTITTDTNSNFYVMGDTNLSLDNNTNAGKNDIFLIKYNSNGVKVWSKLIGEATNEGATKVATDNNGNIYVGGYIDSNQTNEYNHMSFVSKYNNSGTHIWTKKITNYKDSSKLSDITKLTYSNIATIMIDKNNNVYIAGAIRGMKFENQNILQATDVFTSAYVMKFDLNGEKEFGKVIATSFNSAITDIKQDNNGNIYLIGTKKDGLSSLKYHSFIIKTLSIQEVIFSKDIYSSGDPKTASAILKSLSIDSNDNIYLGGTTLNSTNIDGMEIPIHHYDSIFIMKYK
ncbi:MAG: cadherin-like domain-containing protein [Epsilonproteobacteria bacterium]|nr:cadherin-like domain-containing protein [Campylobacterota bacterium]